MSKSSNIYQIISLKDGLSVHLDELVRMDKLCLSDYELWEKDNFLMDLPCKGQLSKLAIIQEKLAGYLICSSYGSQTKCHGHRMAVHPDYRGLGMAKGLWRETLKECINLGITVITLEIPNEDIPARGLYGKLGFKSLKGAELVSYLREKCKENLASRFNDKPDGSGAYFIEVEDLILSLGK